MSEVIGIVLLVLLLYFMFMPSNIGENAAKVYKGFQQTMEQSNDK